LSWQSADGVYAINLALFVVITTDASCGAINAMHDSLMPIAGMIPLLNIQLGEVIFGGVGAGLYGILMFAVLAVFIAGLMVGRTPEYLGRKIGGREMKLAMIGLLIHPIMILWPTGIFAATSWGQKAEFNPGPHGFSEVMYEFSSASANNGSGFEGLGDTWGLNDNPNPAPTSQAWDLATVIVICISRFIPIIAPIALAAGMACLADPPAIEERRVEVAAARDAFAAALTEIGISNWPSHANFVLANPGGDDHLWYEGLLRRGFLVRPGSEYGLRGHLRITIGPSELMASVASAMADVAGELERAG